MHYVDQKKEEKTMFKIVKRYFDKGIYSKEDVSVFVTAGKISSTEYKEITGEEYQEE